jgi:signal transduction histidine kinase
VRRQLTLSAIALVAVTLLATAVPLGVAVRGLLVNRALDTLQGAVEQVALLLDVGTRTCGELQLRVSQAGGDRAILSVIAVDGAVITSTSLAPTVPVADELRAFELRRPARAADAGRLGVAVPLSTDVCGTAMVLHASESDAELRRAVRGAWTAIGAVAVVVAVAAAGGTWWWGRRLAAPFEALAGAAHRLGQGDFSARAPRSGLPEADAIADALDGTAGRLGRAVERSTAFTADASHQLRTPLTALRLHLDTLEALVPGDDPARDGSASREALAAAQGEADRLQATIEDLVALTRIDTAEAPVDLTALVAGRLPAWRALAADAGRALTDDLRPVPVVSVRAGAVAQAVQVVLDNALAHGRGTITVRVAPARPDEPSSAVRVCVEDEGAGPDAVADRPGGRGLPLARALVTAEGGRLTVGGEPGRTVVCLVLPGEPAEPVAPS